MDLPEFQPAALGLAGEWHDVIATADVKPGTTTRVDCDGRGLFVHRHSKGWRVYDSRCPHQTTNIPHLALEGHTLTCPKHQWTFDIRSGACIKNGTSPLKQWETKVVKGRLMARW
jgi:nitrite reductase/ring-hydroxylating ferredoxin subunit